MHVSTHNTTTSGNNNPACTPKFRVQAVVFCVGLLLLIAKFAAYFITDSLGVLTDAMESIVNVIAGAVGLWSIWTAAKPRDADHPYGHGKVELLTASVEGILIMVAGAIIIYEGVMRIFDPSMPQSLDIGIIIIAAAGIINAILGAWSIRVGKRSNSMALIAGGKHLLSDTYSTIGLVSGLLLLYFLQWAWIDSALALIFGGIIIVTGIGIIKKTAANLIDTTDGEAIVSIANAITAARQEDWVDVHDLRVINYGEMMHIDCHLTLPSYYSIALGHDKGDELETVLHNAVAPHTTLISVHSDACDSRMCANCAKQVCDIRAHEFVGTVPLTIGAITEDDDSRAARLGAI